MGVIIYGSMQAEFMETKYSHIHRYGKSGW